MYICLELCPELIPRAIRHQLNEQPPGPQQRAISPVLSFYAAKTWQQRHAQEGYAGRTMTHISQLPKKTTRYFEGLVNGKSYLQSTITLHTHIHALMAFMPSLLY